MWGFEGQMLWFWGGGLHGRVSVDVPRLKRYVTSASGMIGMDERDSDGSHSSSSSSPSSHEGPECLEGQDVEPRLTETRATIPLLQQSLIFYALFMAFMILHMNACRFQSHIWSAYVSHEFASRGSMWGLECIHSQPIRVC